MAGWRGVVASVGLGVAASGGLGVVTTSGLGVVASGVLGAVTSSGLGVVASSCFGVVASGALGGGTSAGRLEAGGVGVGVAGVWSGMVAGIVAGSVAGTGTVVGLAAWEPGALLVASGKPYPFPFSRVTLPFLPFIMAFIFPLLIPAFFPGPLGTAGSISTGAGWGGTVMTGSR